MLDNEVLERANETLNNALLENERLKKELSAKETELAMLMNRANSYRNALLALAKEIN